MINNLGSRGKVLNTLTHTANTAPYCSRAFAVVISVSSAISVATPVVYDSAQSVERDSQLGTSNLESRIWKKFKAHCFQAPSNSQLPTSDFYPLQPHADNAAIAAAVHDTDWQEPSRVLPGCRSNVIGGRRSASYMRKKLSFPTCGRYLFTASSSVTTPTKNQPPSPEYLARSTVKRRPGWRETVNFKTGS